jgi:hypothetical protein
MRASLTVFLLALLCCACGGTSSPSADAKVPDADTSCAVGRCCCDHDVVTPVMCTVDGPKCQPSYQLYSGSQCSAACGGPCSVPCPPDAG